MRIALCFSGQLRNVESTYYQSYKQNVIDANPQHQIDCFVHGWFDNTTVGSVFYAANHVPDSVVACDPISNDIISQVYTLYNPVRLELQRPQVFDEKNYNERKLLDAVPQNGLSRLYSLFRAVKLKSEYEEENNFSYDVVVTTRFDFVFQQPISFDVVTNKGVYHPGYSPHGFNVCYAMGDSETMNTYSYLYYNVDIVFNSGATWCDELLALRYLQLTNTSVYDFSIPCTLNRGTNR